MKLAVGTGEKEMRGYLKNDIRNLPHIDFVCPAWELDKLVAPNTVELVFSDHFFEHLTFERGERVLEVWYSLLQNGGKVLMQLPDMEVFVKHWINGIKNNDEDLFEFATKGFWGWQRESELGELWDVHKSGYTAKSLERLVVKKGFVNFVKHKTKVGNLKVSFEKREMQ